MKIGTDGDGWKMKTRIQDASFQFNADRAPTNWSPSTETLGVNTFFGNQSISNRAGHNT